MTGEGAVLWHWKATRSYGGWGYARSVGIGACRLRPRHGTRLTDVSVTVESLQLFETTHSPNSLKYVSDGLSIYNY